MKDIKLKYTSLVSPTLNGPAMSLDDARSNAEAAMRNGQKIIWSALSIENNFNFIILKYFFEKCDKKWLTFKEQILSSSSFSFSHKRNFVLHLLRELKLLEGQDLSKFEALIAKVIKIRNAFAHGSIIEKVDGTYISYFEGKPQEMKLDDDYWVKVENTFNETLEITQKILEELHKKTDA